MASILRVERLTKSFRGLRAIANLSFDVREGEIVGLIGPNGAGKTTAVNLIAGALPCDSGEVWFEDRRVTGLAPHRLTRLGLVRTFQATNLYRSSTVRDNMLRGAFVHGYAGFWRALLETASARARHRQVSLRIEMIVGELGLTEVADVPAGDLPYGHQKTLGLGMALAASPRLLMLDEPAAGLSDDEADHISGIIERINGTGVSIVVVDHNMRFISRLCHRVVVLHHGAELAVGTPAEVTSDPRVIAVYLGTVDGDP